MLPLGELSGRVRIELRYLRGHLNHAVRQRMSDDYGGSDHD